MNEVACETIRQEIRFLEDRARFLYGAGQFSRGDAFCALILRLELLSRKLKCPGLGRDFTPAPAASVG